MDGIVGRCICNMRDHAGQTAISAQNRTRGGEIHNPQATQEDTNNNLSLGDEDDPSAVINVLCAFIIPVVDLTMPVSTPYV